MRKTLIASLLPFIFSACTVFTVSDPVTGNIVVKTTGAPLLNRKDSFTVTRSWLDKDNVLQELRVDRNTDENASAQVTMMQLLKDAYSAGGAK